MIALLADCGRPSNDQLYAYGEGLDALLYHLNSEFQNIVLKCSKILRKLRHFKCAGQRDKIKKHLYNTILIHY